MPEETKASEPEEPEAEQVEEQTEETEKSEPRVVEAGDEAYRQPSPEEEEGERPVH